VTELGHIAAALAYGLAAVLGALALARGGGSRRTEAGLLWAGVLVHAGAFVSMHSRPTVPLDSFPAALSLIGWLVPSLYLISIRVSQVRAVSPWVAGVAAAFTALAAGGLLLGPAFAPAVTVGESGPWSHAHVLLSTLGFSLLALTSVAGTAYLFKQAALKRKRLVRFALPSLESLDRMEHWTLNLGFLLLTLGVVTGFAWGLRRGSNPWTQHSAWLIAAWAVYLVPLSQRILRHKHGEKPARFVVGGFAFLAFSYLGIRVLGIQS
jgi:ABC-type uncharacterized transport system permease subunit